MKRIDFFSLARPIQERFVDAARGQGAPAPLLVSPAPLPYAALRWAALAVALAVTWLFVISVGYGNLESRYALQPGWFLVLHVGLPVLAVVAGFRARAKLRERFRLPYLPTVYLFPVGVVDARSEMVAVHGWDELTDQRIDGGSAKFSFQNGSFGFRIASAEQGAELGRRVDELRSQVTSGTLSDQDWVRLDPIRDNGFRNPFSPAESMRPPKPKRLPVVPLALGAVAALLGYGAWAARNSLGEGAIYEQARLKDSVEGYRAYLERGGKRTEVVDLLLPRAELREAVASNSVDAVEKYMAAHPGTKIAGEVQTALRAALLRELEIAKAKSSITALREFEARRKQHLALVPEVAQARYAYLTGVLERFHREFKPSQEIWQLARRLIVYADKHGPSVQIRFVQREAKNLEKNERQLMASAYFGGQSTLPSRYIIGPPARAAEQRAGKELAAQLGKIFPEDLLKFEVGPPLPPATPDKPEFDVPTLFISYRLEISGAFVTKRPRAVLAGIGLIAESALSVPDKEPPHPFKHSAWHSPETHKIDANETPVATVYEELVTKAFTRFVSKYSAPWLGKD